MLAVGGQGSDGHALEHGEGIELHDHAILERARLRLVGVADEVVRSCGLLGDGRPLAPGREGRPATSDELGGEDLVDHRLGPHRQRPLEADVAT